MKEDEAKRALVYYFRKSWEAAGLKWDSDNTTEVEGIIEDIVTAVKKEN